LTLVVVDQSRISSLHGAPTKQTDFVQRAVMVARIATGEIEDKVTDDGKNAAAVALGTGVLTNDLSATTPLLKIFNNLELKIA
jgi:hypothetical protein